jgi:formylaminopyrimidine deformylase / aminopyrimidine aminohydrolase
MDFTATLYNENKHLWDIMLSHRFLTETRDGKIGKETFARWMKQDYLFVRAAIPFIAGMIPKAPERHWEAHSNVVSMLQKELRLFEERAAAADISFKEIVPSFTNHAYIQFLLATVAYESYQVVYTVLYAAEKAYHESWKIVQEGLDKKSIWYPFVENWAGDAFAQYVRYLENELNILAAGAGTTDITLMKEYYRITLQYEIAFWEMAVTSEAWPGITG